MEGTQIPMCNTLYIRCFGSFSTRDRHSQRLLTTVALALTNTNFWLHCQRIPCTKRLSGRLHFRNWYLRHRVLPRTLATHSEPLLNAQPTINQISSISGLMHVYSGFCKLFPSTRLFLGKQSLVYCKTRAWDIIILLFASGSYGTQSYWSKTGQWTSHEIGSSRDSLLLTNFNPRYCISSKVTQHNVKFSHHGGWNWSQQ